MSTEKTFGPSESDTLVSCPLCDSCPLCKGERMITFAEAIEHERHANIDLVALETDPPPKDES